MDSVSPDEVCIAGNQSAASGMFNTDFGNFGKLTDKPGWLELDGSRPRSRSRSRHHHRHPVGHGYQP